MIMKPRKIQLIPTAVMAALASLASFHAVSAETYYWDANGATTEGFTTAATGTWGTSAFWSTDSTGLTTGANTAITLVDDVNFGSATSGFSTASTVGFSTPQSVRSITVGAGNSNTLVFSNTGGGPLTLGSGSVITNNSASSVTFQGQLAGSNGFEKAGTGSVILTSTGGATTISGEIKVSAGILQVNNTALSKATTVAINSGTLISATTAANAIGGTISFGGGTLQYNQNPGTDYSAQFSTAANQQYRINVITAAGPTPRVATFSTNLSSTGGSLFKTGTGILILSAANTFTGTTTVENGTLQLNNALALQNSALDTNGSIAGTVGSGIVLNSVTSPTFGGFTGSKNLASVFNSSTGNYSSVSEVTLNPGTGASHSYSGVIANGASGMKLTKTGNGTQTLTGTNTYSGATKISAGTLSLGASGVIADSSIVNLDGGILNTADGVVETLHSIQATSGKLILGTTSTTGSADITLLNDSVIHNIDVGVNSTLRVAAGKTLTQTATGVTAQLATGDIFTMDISSEGVAHLSGAINSGGFDGAVTKTGSGTLRLTGATSQWGGNTVIENGTIEFNTIANYDVVSSLGDGDNGGTNDAILKIGSTATAATLKMIGTEVKNSSNRSIQLGSAGGGIHVDDVAQTLTLSGVVSNATTSGALTKAGAGTLALSNANTYSGGTTVTVGTLLVNNATDSGTGSGSVNVESGATLGGSGTISGAVNISGVLSPGNSIESLGTGALTLNSGSSFNYEMNTSTVAGDLLHVTGGLNIDSNATLDLTDLATLSQALAVDTKFTLLSYTGVWNNGTFNGYADDSTFLFASNTWRIDYNDPTGASNFTSDQDGAAGFVTLTVIPEPSSLLLGFGGLGALLVRRKRRN